MKARAAAALFTVWISKVDHAVAHGPEVVEPGALWRTWNFDPVLLGSLLLAPWLYVRGVRALRAHAGAGRGVANSNLIAFGAGTAAMLVALISPLDHLGGTLLSAHMAQHALLVGVVPPLLLLGRPGAAFAWAVPDGWRRNILGSGGWRSVVSVGEALSRPLVAATLHGLTLWIWHAPTAFNAAVAHSGVHALEHATFLGTALLFWRAVLNGRTGQSVARALGADVATLIHGGLLGALITLAPYPLYRWYEGRTGVWGLDALEDQQLAGLLMWVPMSVVYLAAGLALAACFISGRHGGLPSLRTLRSLRGEGAIRGGRPRDR